MFDLRRSDVTETEKMLSVGSTEILLKQNKCQGDTLTVKHIHCPLLLDELFHLTILHVKHKIGYNVTLKKTTSNTMKVLNFTYNYHNTHVRQFIFYKAIVKNNPCKLM